MVEVSVIVPTYQRAALLRRALDSVQTQTYKEWEIVVVNDGYEEATAAVAAAYPNCRYLSIDHTGLPAVARNAGARLTNSKYLAFLDSDDQWLPHKLETQMKVLRAVPCTFVCSNALMARDDGLQAQNYLKSGQGENGKVLACLLSDNFVITSTVVLNRELFNRLGGFCEDPLLRGMEDYDLWLRVARAGDISYLAESLAVYRPSEDSLSGKMSELCHWRTMAAIYMRAASFISKSDSRLYSTVRRQADACSRAICDVHLRNRRFSSFAVSLGAFCLNRPLAAAKYLAAKAAKRTQ